MCRFADFTQIYFSRRNSGNNRNYSVPVSHYINDRVHVGCASMYPAISEFMRNRVAALGGGRMVIDGMLKDCNSGTGSLSEFSRKGAKKGSRDISLMYAYDHERNEPIAAKPYPGNMLDQTSVSDFISEFNIKKGVMIMDRGFLSAVIASKVKNMVVKSQLNKRYSFRQVFNYMAKYKKVRTSEDGTWQTAVNLKYIGEIIEKLGI